MESVECRKGGDGKVRREDERKNNAERIEVKWKKTIHALSWIYVFNRNAKMFHAIYECIQQMYLAFLIWENLHRRCILHYSHTSELPFKINLLLDLNVDSRVFHNFDATKKIHTKIFHYNFSAFLKNVYTIYK